MNSLWNNIRIRLRAAAKGTLLGLLFVWRSIAAVVAIVLIVAALAGGFWLGRYVYPSDTAQASGDVGADLEHEHSESDAAQWYYCSMHPTFRSTDPDVKCAICFMDLIPMPADLAGDTGPRELRMSAAAMKLAQIQTAPVARFFPTGQVRLVGKIHYDETRLATIAAYVPGRLDRLFVDYTGMQVQKGDHLVEIYSPELVAAQEELRQALGAVSNQQSTSDLVRRSNQIKLQAVRDKLRLWGLSAQQITQLEQEEESAERFTVYAPLGGVITERMATEGQYVTTGQPIYKVADLSTVWLHLEAYESQLGWLRYGQDVEFTTEAYPGEAFHGRITFINPVLDQDTRTTRVRVNVPNDTGRLKPGMFARAVVRAKMGTTGVVFDSGLHGRWICPMHPEVVKDETGTCDVCGMALVPAETMDYVEEPRTEAPPLVVPATAPLITGARAVVYVQDPDSEKPSFEGREVILGARAGDYYVVREGLEEGERVVVNGAFKIDSALQIAAKPSMMNPMDHDAASQMADEADTTIEVPAAFLESLSPVYEGYLSAQEALATDDLDQYLKAESEIRTAIQRTVTVGMHGEALGWLNRLTQSLTSADSSVFAVPADTIESARTHFDVLSETVIGLSEHFGHGGDRTYYKAYCPMAFDNRGAYWVQRDGETISNPYFGEMMLRCGSFEGSYEPVNTGAVSDDGGGEQ
ncbi:MAG: efflux RND transporter periplasmic adaptor subunit [Planctomycetes bacterium]|nr:efflux RND transporter periplasmic adaptor subunit [Planctomycetota bacterium]NOG52979.1 efflux RND transporter periplasmic adaptor subunit [Planctomycetota bacterium]